MTERRERTTRRARNDGPGWLATLFGAALLMVLGFGIGLLAGAAFEEPDLVMKHLSGRSTEVALEDPLDSRPEGPEPVPPPPLAGGDPAAGAAPEVTPPSVSSSPPPPAPPAVDGFSVQVGAFGERGAASALTKQLRELGFSVFVYEAPGSAAFKVRVGPVASREEAEKLASRLKSKHRLPTWVVSQDKR